MWCRQLHASSSPGRPGRGDRETRQGHGSRARETAIRHGTVYTCPQPTCNGVRPLRTGYAVELSNVGRASLIVHVQNMNNMNNKVASAASGNFFIFICFWFLACYGRVNVNSNNVKLLRPSKSQR